MKAEQIVRRTIQEHGLISSGDSVVLGLSGGPDSLCLLHILAELQSELGFSLSCVHLNHLMRGEKATEDVSWLKIHCKSLSIPLDVNSCDVRLFAKEQGISVEEAGRLARQRALFNKAQSLESIAPAKVLVAFAHNKDDQAETVLMRMLRGSGVHGLAAMEYFRQDGIIRPLLDTPRKAIEEYCSINNLTPRFDSTNASREFTRNRIRLELIPLLEKEYNPNLKDTLSRLSNNAREDDAFLEKLAREKLTEEIYDHGSNDNEQCSLSYPISILGELDPAVGKRLIKLLFAKIGLEEDISHTHLKALWEAINKNNHGATIEFPGNYLAELSYGIIRFHKRENFFKDAICKKNAWVLSHSLISIDDAPNYKDLPIGQRILDADKVNSIGFPIILRTRLPGDHIQPLGFSGTKKLQDYFVDAKVEKGLRDSLPLVCAGKEILWILYGPINEKFKITKDTQTVILLDIHEEIC